MGVTPTNLVVGPATLYYGIMGTTEPAYSAIASPPGAGWTDVGMTADGTAILLEIDQTVTDFGCEQIIDRIAGRITKRIIQITATLQEATLQNMQLALNGLATITQGTGYSVLDPVTASAASQPNYTAFILDGWAPTTGTTETACRRRIAVRKCLSASKVDLEYEKTKPVLYSTTWSGYYVSPGIAPYEVIDQDS
jgi:hypothetical protein